jgi:hypothetical protein
MSEIRTENKPRALPPHHPADDFITYFRHIFATEVMKFIALNLRRYVIDWLIVSINRSTDGSKVNSTIFNIRDQQNGYIKNISNKNLRHELIILVVQWWPV